MLSMLAALGLILFVFESFLPLPVPWMRPGLGNVATILALMYFGAGDALKVTLLRIVLGSLLIGRLFTPLFVFAITGGLVSLVVMAVIHRYVRGIGPVGFSAAGAVAHNIVQLAAAWLLFIRSDGLIFLLPLLVMAGVLTGAATGLVAAVVYDKTAGRVGLNAPGVHGRHDIREEGAR